MKIIFEGTLEGTRDDFFEKSKGSQKQLKHTRINLVLNADSEFDISFDINSGFLDEKRLPNSQKQVKTRTLSTM